MVTNLLKNHILSIIVSVLISISISIPNIVLLNKSGSEFLPFTSNSQLSYFEEETYIYSAQIHQMLNGFFWGDPYVWEERNSPSLYLGEAGSLIPIFVLAKLTDSVNFAFILADFIFPTLLFLLIYFSLIKLKFGRKISMICALFVITAPFLSTLFPLIFNDQTRLFGSENLPVFFSRTPHPQISSIYFFASLFATIFIIKNPKIRLFYLWPIILGLSAYSTLFITSTILLGIFLMTPIILKVVPLKKVAVSFAIFFILILPQMLNFLELQKVVDQVDLLKRTTFEVDLLFPAQIRYIFIAFIYLIIKRDELSKTIFAFVFAAALLIDIHQLIIGRNVEADHWISRALGPTSTLTLILILQKVFQTIKLFQSKVIAAGLITGLLLILFSTQFFWINQNINKFDSLGSEQQLFSEIVQSTQKDDVIGSLDYSLNKHLTGMTGRRVYLPPGDRTIVDSSEQFNRLCYLYHLIDPDKTSEVQRSILNYAFGFEVWEAQNVDSLIAKMNDCRLSKIDSLNFKLDYLVIYDKDLGQFRLEKKNENKNAL